MKMPADLLFIAVRIRIDAGAGWVAQHRIQAVRREQLAHGGEQLVHGRLVLQPHRLPLMKDGGFLAKQRMQTVGLWYPCSTALLAQLVCS